jgi:two-component system, chemotaxis family, sensor kinase CheA
VKRILLVDGDPDSRAVYRVMLQYSGYVVDEAQDGARALELLRGGPFDAVVCELTLRGVDGHTLLGELRAAEQTRDLCVIVLTARGLEEDRERALAAGCTDYLVKPLEPKRLLATLEAVLAT